MPLAPRATMEIGSVAAARSNVARPRRTVATLVDDLTGMTTSIYGI
jgi:hypothetical protein